VDQTALGSFSDPFQDTLEEGLRDLGEAGNGYILSPWPAAVREIQGGHQVISVSLTGGRRW
jgi:hypothetical protein